MMEAGGGFHSDEIASYHSDEIPRFHADEVPVFRQSRRIAPIALRTGWALLLIASMLGFMGTTTVRNLEVEDVELKKQPAPANLEELRDALSSLEQDEKSLQQQLAEYGDKRVFSERGPNAIPAVAQPEAVNREFQTAYQQSFGFFDDIPNNTWELMRQRVRERQNHMNMNEPMRDAEEPKQWYQMNWEPDFTCVNERRVGLMGDGPKWVCNPHRIHPISEKRKKINGNGCLVYSVGSNGNFLFEEALQKEVGESTCEIHIFDPVNFEGSTPPNMFFHPWGLESSSDHEKGANFKSIQNTVDELGHSGRVIDVFKIDCEGCEWRTYQDWFTSGVDMHQILVETHGVPENANHFFYTMQNEGYVTFHKEPNTWSSEGSCQEYAFVKLDRSFYEE